jgi:membrane-associated phospholipid phosphatase
LLLCVGVVLQGVACSALAQARAADIPPQATDQSPPQSPAPGNPSGSPDNSSHDSRDPIFYPGDTESFKPLVRKLGANIWLDQKEIWTAPFHMRRRDAPWWILAGAGTAALIATDHKTIDTLPNRPGQIAAANNVSQIGATYTVLPLIAGFYGYGALTDNAKARETGVLGTEALLDSLVVVTVLKAASGRVRPDSTTGERGHFFHGGDSFPSGHTIETWAVASVIAHEYKRGGGRWVPYVAYGLATVVSAARYIGQRHYLSDVVAGATIGWFIGRYVYNTHENHAAHRHHIPKPTITPDINPANKMYAVSIRFGR